MFLPPPHLQPPREEWQAVTPLKRSSAWQILSDLEEKESAEKADEVVQNCHPRCPGSHLHSARRWGSRFYLVTRNPSVYWIPTQGRGFISDGLHKPSLRLLGVALGKLCDTVKALIQLWPWISRRPAALQTLESGHRHVGALHRSWTQLDATPFQWQSLMLGWGVPSHQAPTFLEGVLGSWRWLYLSLAASVA